MIIISTEINEEELKVIQAVQTISEYRNKYASIGEKSFDKLCAFLQLIEETATKKHVCEKCGTEIKLYVIRK